MKPGYMPGSSMQTIWHLIVGLSDKGLIIKSYVSTRSRTLYILLLMNAGHLSAWNSIISSFDLSWLKMAHVLKIIAVVIKIISGNLGNH